MQIKKIYVVMMTLVFLIVLMSSTGVNAPTYSPEVEAAIENIIISNEPTIIYEGAGTTLDYGNGTYTYSTSVGENNTWTGAEWKPYVYNSIDHSVQIGKFTFIHHSDGSISIEHASGALVEKIAWYAQYHLNDVWENFTFDNYAFDGVQTLETNVTAYQRWWSDNGELNVSWTYTNRNYVKIRAQATNLAALAVPVRVIWGASGIYLNGIDYEPLVANITGTMQVYGVKFADTFVFSWLDAIENTPDIAITSVVDQLNRRAGIVFGNMSSVLTQGETMDIDPSINPSVAADADDTGFEKDYGGSFVNDAGNTYNWFSGYYSEDYPYWRFAFAGINQGATISSAVLSIRIFTGQTSSTATIQRCTTINIAALESIGNTPPTITTTNQAAFTANSAIEHTKTVTVTAMIQDEVNDGSWAAGYYMGMRILDTWGFDRESYVIDWQPSGTYAPSISITYTNPNTAPTNGAAPTVGSPLEGGYMAAQKRTYIITQHVSDADGFANINYMELELWNYDRSIHLFTVRYDEDTNAFSEEYGASVITLSGSSSAVESGNTIDASYYFTIEWGIGYYDTALDWYGYVIDEYPASEGLWYDAQLSGVTDETYIFSETATDGSGVIDRGNYDTLDSITVSGYVYYRGTSAYVPDTQVDVWVICSNVAGSPWSDFTWGSGTFSMTVDSDDVVTGSPTTYDIHTVLEGTGAGGANLNFGTEDVTYRADRVQVQSMTAVDDFINIGATGYMDFLLWYDYDDTTFSLAGSTVTCEGLTATHQGSGVWRVSEIESGVIQNTYDTITANDATGGGGMFGVSKIDQNSKSATITWDRIIAVNCYSSDADFHVDVGTPQTAYIQLYYESDNTPVIDGSVTISGVAFAYQTSSDGIWYVTQSNSPAQAKNYGALEAGTVSGNTRGITVKNNNGFDPTWFYWDGIYCMDGGITTAARIDVDTSVTYWLTARISSIAHILGAGDTVYMYDGSTQYEMTWSVGNSRFEYVYTGLSSAGTKHFSCTGYLLYEATYGLSYFIDTGNEDQDVIWDRVEIYDISVADDHVGAGTGITITYLMRYDYLDQAGVVGTFTTDTTADSLGYVSGNTWTATINEAVGTYVFNGFTGCSDSQFGLTAWIFTGSEETIYFDTVRALAIQVSDSRCSYGSDQWVQVQFDYEHTSYGYVAAWSTYPTVTGPNGVITLSQDIGSGWWRGSTGTYSSVDMFDFNTNTLNDFIDTDSILSRTKGAYTSSIIWDRILITVTDVDDTRISTGTAAAIYVSAELEYGTINGAYQHSLGSGDTLYMNDTLMSWNTTYFTLAPNFAQWGLWDFFVNSSSANEATYSITTIYLDSNSVDVIWDTIIITNDGTDHPDERANVGEFVTFWAVAELAYDGHPLGSGDYIKFGNKVMTWNGTHFVNSEYTKYDVGLYTFTINITGSMESTYGIESGQNIPVNMIFDRILIYDMWVDDSRVSTGEDVIIYAILVSEYDGEIMYDGIVQINGTQGIETGSAYNMTLGEATLLAYTGTYYGGSSYGSYVSTWDDISEYSYYGASENYAAWVRVDVNVTFANPDNLNVYVYWGADQWSTYPVGGALLSIWNWNTGTYYSLQSGDLNGGEQWKNFTITNSDWISSTGIVRIRSFAQYDGSNQGVWAKIWYVQIYTDTGLGTWESDPFNYNTAGNRTFLITYANWTLYNITEINYNGWNITYLYTIWDRIEFYVSGVNDDRINYGTQGTVYWSARYESDGTLITSGLTAYLNGSKLLSWNGTHWIYQQTESQVILVGYEILSAIETTYGITSWVQSTSDVSIIWDRIKFLTIYMFEGANDVTHGETNLGNTVEIRVTAVLEYDNHVVGDASDVLYLLAAPDLYGSSEWFALSWDGVNGWWENTKQLTSAADLWLFAANAHDAWENTYGISAVNTNGITDWVIWDSILITNMWTTDDHVNINTNSTVWITCEMEYWFYSGGTEWIRDFNGDDIYLNGTLMTYDDEDRWYIDTLQYANPTNYSFYISSGFWNEWDITALQNVTYIYVCWDRVNFTSFNLNYDWTLSGYNLTVSWTAIYEASSRVWTGNILTLNSTYYGLGSGIYPSEPTGNWTIKVDTISDPVDGITEFLSLYDWAWWDNITAESYYYVIKQPTGDSLFTISFSQLRWVSNNSLIGQGWICMNIRDDINVSNATTDSSSYLYPYTQNIPVPAIYDSIVYKNNATKTIGDRDFNLLWYTVEASTAEALAISVESVAELENSVVVSGATNVDFTWYVYNEGAPSGETNSVTGAKDFKIEFDMIMTDGQHNYSIKFDAGASGIRWFNSSYEINLLVDTDFPEQKGTYVEIKGTTNLDCSWYIYDRDAEEWTPYSGTVTMGGFSFLFTKNATAGLHRIGAYFNVSSGSFDWENSSYYVESVSATHADIRFAFFDNSNNWIPFETINVQVTWSEGTFTITSAVITVPVAENITVIVYDKWGILIANETFAYTQFKPIILNVYELIIDNEADHPVRLDMSYNGTYPNITIILPRNFPRFLYLAPANYTMIFTYYVYNQVAGAIINYEELTGYYVTYNYEFTNIGYLKYTGMTLQDIDDNIDYTRVYTNNNIDVVDTNVLAIPYPPNVPQNIVTPEMLWIVVGAFGVVSFLFALGGSIFRGRAIAKKSKVFYKSQGAVAEEIADAEGKEYYRAKN